MHGHRHRFHALGPGGAVEQLAGTGHQDDAEAVFFEGAQPAGEDKAGLRMGDADHNDRRAVALRRS
jgi:hypothetical protein